MRFYNMGVAQAEYWEKMERLHKESIHDDGCSTMFPGGTCDCTQQSLRGPSTYEEQIQSGTDEQRKGFFWSIFRR